MKLILDWLKSKNITSHTVVAVIVAAATALMTDEQVRSFFVSIFQTHPKLVTMTLSVAGIILKYSHSSTQPTQP